MRFTAASLNILRNEDLNARNYFAPTGRKPEYRRNLYGGTIGGPILQDRLFFFGDYQGIKQADRGDAHLDCADAGAARGHTSVRLQFTIRRRRCLTGSVYTRRQFPNDTINVPFDTAAQALLARIPLPTSNAADE